MALRILDEVVNEGSTCKLEFDLVDYNDNPIAVGNITSCTFTLYAVRGSLLINNRNGVLNGSDDIISSFDGSGAFSFTLTALDNVIMSSNRKRNKQAFEEHIFTTTITATVNSEDIVLQEAFLVKVADLTYKP